MVFLVDDLHFQRECSGSHTGYLCNVLSEIRELYRFHSNLLDFHTDLYKQR